MIRIVLLGRTGNILFQYALGRVLAEKHGVPLVLDASWYNREGWREISYLLDLPLKAKVVRRLSLGARALRNLTGGKHYWEWRGVPFLRERADDQSYDPSFLDAPSDCVLFGYFQTPSYFGAMDQELREELKSLLGISKQGRETWLTNLGQDVPATSVAVHVRRTDYLIHPAFQVCGMGYYRNAFDTMRASVPGARFFVFSDDPAWCRENFKDQNATIMDSGNDSIDPLHDLRLMSQASHHIICNSSYSWWAAWLAKREGQHVLLPDRWYAKDIIAPIEEKMGKAWETVGTSAIIRNR